MNKSISSLAALAIAWSAMNPAIANNACDTQNILLSKASQAVPQKCIRMPQATQVGFIFKGADDIQKGIDCYSAKVARVNALQDSENCLFDVVEGIDGEEIDTLRSDMYAIKNEIRVIRNKLLKVLNWVVTNSDDCTTVTFDWKTSVNTILNCSE